MRDGRPIRTFHRNQTLFCFSLSHWKTHWERYRICSHTQTYRKERHLYIVTCHLFEWFSDLIIQLDSTKYKNYNNVLKKITFLQIVMHWYTKGLFIYYITNYVFHCSSPSQNIVMLYLITILFKHIINVKSRYSK